MSLIVPWPIIKSEGRGQKETDSTGICVHRFCIPEKQSRAEVSNNEYLLDIAIIAEQRETSVICANT